MKRLLLVTVVVLSLSKAASLEDILVDMHAKNHNMTQESKTEKTYYCTPKKTKIRKSILFDSYQNKTSEIEYSCDTGEKLEEIAYMYDKNLTSKSRPIAGVKKNYWDNGKLWIEKSFKSAGKRTERIYMKHYARSGHLTSKKTYKNGKKYRTYIYDANTGLISSEEGSTDHGYEVIHYQKGSKQSVTYYTSRAKNNIIKRELFENGQQRSDIYSHGALFYSSYCAADKKKIYYFMSTLEAKYATRFAALPPPEVYCKNLNNNKDLLLALNFYQDGVWLVAFDIEKDIIKTEYFSKNPISRYKEGHLEISKKSYKSSIVENAIDIILDSQSPQNPPIYQSYIVRNSKIISLSTPTFELKTVEREAKNSKKISIETIKAMLFEMQITNANVNSYNNIGYYLYQNGFYKEAVYLLEAIIQSEPKRVVAYYNLADAYWKLNDKVKAKTNYRIYIENMRDIGKESKIPKIVLKRVE